MRSCATEPIHRPGRVQSFGGLLALDEAARVSHASSNVAQWLDVDATACIGASLTALFAAASAQRIAESYASLAVGEQVLLLEEVACRGRGISLDVLVTRADKHGFLEFENASDTVQASQSNAWGNAGMAAFYTQLQRSAQRLMRTESSTALCQVLCEEVRHLFGHDRVLVYRFDPHWHGIVIAERTGAPFPPYLGHKFPESDIPQQARALFLVNRLRMIPDIAAPMYDLVGEGADRVDMMRLQLRSPAQVHLEYMRNMQTQASMTLSLRLGGRLWGLVACHHATPRYLSARLRNAAELLVGQANALLQQKIYADGEALRTRLDEKKQRVIEHIRQASDVLRGMCTGPVTINEVNETGGGCAVFFGGQWRTVGSVPPEPACSAVVGWLASSPPIDMTATDHMADKVPELAEHSAVASGLLAVSLPQSKHAYVLWFRPELKRETVWAGDPHKEGEHDEGEGPASRNTSLHPRTSFSQYTEVTQGYSSPVLAEEIDVALSLRKAIGEIDLFNRVANERKLREAAEKERQRAEGAVAVREHVLNMVSHDLRNPLNAIVITVSAARRRAARRKKAASLEEQAKLLDNIERAGGRMSRLIEDILSLSKIQAGKIQLERSVVDGKLLLREVQQLLEPIAQAQNLRLQVRAESDAVVCDGDGERLMQALGNLVSNAIKFSPSGGVITLSVDEEPNAKTAVFRVQDNGPGISDEDRGRIFETYWQAQGETAKKGLGLGLSIVKQIVEAHGGGVWVDSKLGEGSTFCFTCPTPAEQESGRGATAG